MGQSGWRVFIQTSNTQRDYKSLCSRKKNPQQKKERAAETFF